mmetsp:Transcript_18370/g.45193  ORF Transcript_18370/g.45193 Transcript_18370/m.45193 type:complete len:357 (-) Transcript_18370:558-1628(-)
MSPITKALPLNHAFLRLGGKTPPRLPLPRQTKKDTAFFFVFRGFLFFLYTYVARTASYLSREKLVNEFFVPVKIMLRRKGMIAQLASKGLATLVNDSLMPLQIGLLGKGLAAEVALVGLAMPMGGGHVARKVVRRGKVLATVFANNGSWLVRFRGQSRRLCSITLRSCHVLQISAVHVVRGGRQQLGRLSAAPLAENGIAARLGRGEGAHRNLVTVSTRNTQRQAQHELGQVVDIAAAHGALQIRVGKGEGDGFAKIVAFQQVAYTAVLALGKKPGGYKGAEAELDEAVPCLESNAAAKPALAHGARAGALCKLADMCLAKLALGFGGECGAVAVGLDHGCAAFDGAILPEGDGDE